jgi:ferredoxin
MPSQVDPQKCSGCGTCAEKCPEEAITMDLIPVVDIDKCTECGICVIICQYGARDIVEVMKYLARTVVE